MDGGGGALMNKWSYLLLVVPPSPHFSQFPPSPFANVDCCRILLRTTKSIFFLSFSLVVSLKFHLSKKKPRERKWNFCNSQKHGASQIFIPFFAWLELHSETRRKSISQTVRRKKHIHLFFTPEIERNFWLLLTQNWFNPLSLRQVGKNVCFCLPPPLLSNFVDALLGCCVPNFFFCSVDTVKDVRKHAIKEGDWERGGSGRERGGGVLRRKGGSEEEDHYRRFQRWMQMLDKKKCQAEHSWKNYSLLFDFTSCWRSNWKRQQSVLFRLPPAAIHPCISRHPFCSFFSVAVFNQLLPMVRGITIFPLSSPPPTLQRGCVVVDGGAVWMACCLLACAGGKGRRKAPEKKVFEFFGFWSPMMMMDDCGWKKNTYVV